MSMFRCYGCDENKDSDYIEMYKVGDEDVCEDCFSEVEV